MKSFNKIAIEASNLIDAQPTGISKYSFNLITQLLNNKDFCSQFDLSLLLSLSRWRKRQFCSLKEVKKHWHIKKFLFRNDFSLIHCTGVFYNHNRRIPKIITIHDIAVLKQEHKIPFYTSQETIEKTKKDMDSIAKNANAIIFVSETSRQDFLNLYDFPEKNTSVVYLGSNFSMFHPLPNTETSILKKHKIKPKQYFLYVGGISIRKNVLNIVKAFILNQNKTDYDLVLVGNFGMGADLILEEIQKYDKNRHIKCTGYVTDSEIIELYQNAAAFVFPTYYEGFGMPIIDAMNFNLPVLVGNRGAAPEISKGFATTVDPFDIESISNGLEKVLHTDIQQLIKAKEYAQSITWQKCAEETFNVYKTLL